MRADERSLEAHSCGGSTLNIPTFNSESRSEACTQHLYRVCDARISRETAASIREADLVHSGDVFANQASCHSRSPKDNNIVLSHAY